MLRHQIFECQTKKTDKYVVLLHGFGGNHRVWKYQIPILQKQCNVLAIDLPSHNDNNLLLTQIDNSIKSVTQEIITVLDEYNIKNAVFIGVSLGTIFIKQLEISFPEYIDYAIMVGAVCEVGTFLTTVVNVFSRIGDKLPFAFVYRVFSKVLMPSKDSKESRKIFCKCAEALNRHEFKAWMNIFKENFSLSRKYKNKTNPRNLYIAGVSDLCFLKGIKSEAKNTNGRFVLFKNCGHVCNIDQRERFNKLLLLEINKGVVTV